MMHIDVFVRSLDHIAQDNPAATGLRIKREELVAALGEDAVNTLEEEILEKTCAIFEKRPGIYRDTIANAMKKRDMSVEILSSLSVVPVQTIYRLMRRNPPRIDIHEVVKICKVLDIDPKTIGYKEP